MLRVLAEVAGKVASWPADRFPLSRADRLKPEHPVRHLCDNLAAALSFDAEMEVYQGKTSELAVLPTWPVSLVIGQQIIKRFQSREQRFLIGRLIARARDGSAVATFVDPAWLCDFVGAAIHLVQPNARLCGKPNDDLEKKIGKALSRKGRKALEELIPTLGGPPPRAACTGRAP